MRRRAMFWMAVPVVVFIGGCVGILDLSPGEPLPAEPSGAGGMGTASSGAGGMGTGGAGGTGVGGMGTGGGGVGGMGTGGAGGTGVGGMGTGGAGGMGACMNDGNCSNGYYCDINVCVAKKAAGTCNGPNECATGNCVDGYCCTSACDGVCEACNLAGHEGACSPVDPLVDDAMCPANQTCDGGGMCKLDIGQPCSMPSECASGVCSVGACAP